MSSELGRILSVSLFGESHGAAVGAVLTGLPAGEEIDLERLEAFTARRRPGRALTTGRAETDSPVFLSGLRDGRTTGSPLAALIENSDARSGDYAELLDTPRPGHADYTAYVKYGGAADMRGGGHFSGRLTAPLCVAGSVALQILERRGVYIGAHLYSVGLVNDTPFDPVAVTKDQLLAAAGQDFPALAADAAAAMQQEIARAAAEGDSLGGVVECAALGLPAGLGGPLFDGLEGRLAAALFGIPAVKGVEFGSGFAGATWRGSANNDPFILRKGKIVTQTNHHGGLLGGITTGLPLLFRAAFKPTPSISREQRTVSLSRREETTLRIAGRHDPCVAMRAVPVTEAVAALVILDTILEEQNYGTFRTEK